MDWKSYNTCLIPLIKKFGSYSTDEIKTGFYYWKNKDQAEFLQEIDRSIMFNHRLDIKEAFKPKRVTYETAGWREELENRQISDDFLDNMLANNDAKSLLELVFKVKNNLSAS